MIGFDNKKYYIFLFLISLLVALFVIFIVNLSLPNILKYSLIFCFIFIILFLILYLFVKEKKYFQSISQSNNKAQLANIAKSRFLAVISHEIRTPMNGILGMSELLLNTKITQEQKSYIEAIKSSGSTLLYLISDILDFSKIEAGKLELFRKPADIIELIESTIELLEPRAYEKNIEIASYLDLNIEGDFYIDPHRLRQVFFNIIGNAIKFTEKGGIIVRADIVDKNSFNYRLKFSVIDTGLGMDKEQIKTVFNEFTQLDNSYSRQYEGTGLGLAIAKNIIELMGGCLSVDSNKDMGSNFWFEIDIIKENSGETSSFNKLIEQNIALISESEILKNVFSDYFDNCVGTFNIYKGLDVSISDTIKYNTVFYDYELFDKFTKIQNLKTVARNILLISPYQRGVLNQIKKLGFDGYLIKPIRRNSLFKCLIAEKLSFDNNIYKKELYSNNIGNNKRILLVEDNDINALLVISMLEKLGYKIIRASNGFEAIDIIKRSSEDWSSNGFYCILMDMQMPNMDGLETTIKIRKIRGIPNNLPIIALTANAHKEDKEACYNSGMNGYLLKPFSHDSLMAELKKFI